MGVKEQCAETLEALAWHEAAISELYSAYAKRFKDCQEFWLRLAEDESRHSSLLLSGKDSLAESELKFDLSKASRALAESSAKFVRRERERFEAKPDATLEEALSLALKVERSFFESAVFNAFDESGEELKKIISALISDTAAHVKLVEEQIGSLKPSAAKAPSASEPSSEAKP